MSWNPDQMSKQYYSTRAVRNFRKYADNSDRISGRERKAVSCAALNKIYHRH